MKSKSVKNSLTLMCLMIVLVSVMVIGGISILNISTMTSTANKNYENARLDGYNTEIKSQVQSVIAILQAEYDKSQNGDLTEDEAKKEAAEIVRVTGMMEAAISGSMIPTTTSLCIRS